MSDTYEEPVNSVNDLNVYDSTAPFISAKTAEKIKHVHMISKNSIDNNLEGYIMPDFDRSGMSPHDTAYAVSTRPMWGPKKDSASRDFPQTSWGLAIAYYAYVGENKRHFMAPVMRKHLRGGSQIPTNSDLLADAFEDVRNYIRKHPDLSKERKKQLMERAPMGSQTSDILPSLRRGMISLALTRTKDYPDLEMSAVIYTGSAHEYLIAQARVRRDTEEEILDPSFDRYLVGDITNPKGAILWKIGKHLISAKDAEATNCLLIEQRPGSFNLEDIKRNRRPITETELAARVDLFDPEAWEFPEYQDMVDHLVDNHPMIPHEYIKEACGHRADVKDRDEELMRSRASRRQAEAAGKEQPQGEAAHPLLGGGQPAERSSALAGGPSLPPTAPPAAAPVTAPPAAPASVTIHVSVPGGTPYTIDASQKSAAAAQNPGLMEYANGAWVTIPVTPPPPAGVIPPPPAAVIPPPPAAAPTPATPVAVESPKGEVAALQDVTDKEVSEWFPDHDTATARGMLTTNADATAAFLRVVNAMRSDTATSPDMADIELVTSISTQ